MNDQDIIKSAYEDELKKLFDVLCNAYVVAQNQGDKDLAAQRFQAGLAIARSARDKALTLV